MKIAGAVHLVIWVLDVAAGNGHANDARRTDESSPSDDVATDKTSKATPDEKELIMRYSTFEMAMKICPRHDNDVHTYNFTIKGVCAGFRCVKSYEGNTDEVFIQPEVCPRRETPCPVSDRKRLLEFPRCCPSDCGVDRVKRQARALPLLGALLPVLWIGFKVLMAHTGRFLIQQALRFAVKQLGRSLLRQSLKKIKDFAINSITKVVKANMRGAVREVIKRTVNKAVTSYNKKLRLIKKGVKKRQQKGNKNKKVGKGKKKKKKEKKRRRKKKKESCECDYSASITIEKGKSSEEEDSQGKGEDEDDEDEEGTSEEQSCEREEGDDKGDQCVGEDDNKDDDQSPEEQLRALYDAE